MVLDHRPPRTERGESLVRRDAYKARRRLLIVAISLAVGLLPAFDPSFYNKFPKDFQVIFGSSITATVLVVFVLNLAFNHFAGGDEGESAVQLAVDEGAVVSTPPAEPGVE